MSLVQKYVCRLKLLVSIRTILCVFPLIVTVQAHAVGYSASDASASTIPQPSCYNGSCRTPAKVMWGADDVAGTTDTWTYFNSPEDAMYNESSRDYGSFAGFCAYLHGSYLGIVIGQLNASQINGNLYSSYYGNCGVTPYSTPNNDYRGFSPAYGFCPTGYSYGGVNSGSQFGSGGPPTGGSCFGGFPPPQPTPYKGLGDACPNTQHPIHIGTGNKYLNEQDYVSTGLHPISLSHSYNSFLHDDAGTGIGWQLNWYGYVITTVSDTQILLRRSSGKGYLFTLTSGTWSSDADVTGKLERLVDINNVLTGWRYTTADGDIESYDINGQITKLTNRDGWVLSINTVGTNTTVSDPLGRTLTYSVDTAGNRVIKAFDGGSYVYHRDTANNLTSVTYPDGKVKTYLYGETAYVSASPNSGVSYTNSLTGIIDENNTRYVTYSYDSAGRAYDEYLAPNAGITPSVEHNNLVYNVDGSGNPTTTVVTDALGSARTYNFTTVLGVVKSTGQNQPAGSGCSASASNLTYDANGNVASRTDFNGNKTTYVYDLTRNLETSRTEGLTSTGATTTATRTITTTWHATWRLPLVITEYTGATASGTALKKTTYVYDTKGNITSFKEEDPVRALSRTTTTTYTYSTVAPGLVVQKVVDGPRTDKSDITTYNYFDANASCAASTSASTATNLGCRGQLQTITNALSQVTTFNRYNHHGQVEQMTDPNGTVTTNTYDLRQRLLTHSISGTGITAQTTTLTYDNAGQITQLKMPDNSTLNYTYDDAHRLTQVQDTLGNKVVYTLDAADNRTAEKTYDPSGTLAKTLTRSYDALNRLQTLTGKE